MEVSLEDVLNSYKQSYKINYYSYNMMGKMLDKKWMMERVKLWKLEDIYIYGGGYLGIQLYHAVNKLAKVKSVVDQAGWLCIEDDTIPVMSLENFKNVYNGEKIIITPMKYFNAIKDELQTFVNKENIIYIGELLEGKVSYDICNI